MFHVPNAYRIRQGHMASADSQGNNGAFVIPIETRESNTFDYHSIDGRPVETIRVAPWNVIASDGGGWDHVSISHPDFIPPWNVMCEIKNLFWDEEDCVLQYHPPKSEYVNEHPNCLHLWRPQGWRVPTPPRWMIG